MTSIHDEEKRLLGYGEKAPVKKMGLQGAIFNFICTTLGAGILSLSFALQLGGWIGLLYFILIGFSTNYAAIKLIKCMHPPTGGRLHTYEDVGEACFGKVGRAVVGVFQTLQLFGVCVIFLIIIGLNMSLMVGGCLTLHDWVLIFALVLMPITWLKTMREISFVAFFGLTASLIVAAAVIIIGFYRASDDKAVIGAHTFATSAEGTVLSFNIAIFSFGVTAVLPTLEAHMERPEKFSFVSNISFLVITSIYVLVAAAGYSGWGDKMNTDGNILSTMADSYAHSEGMLGLVKALTAIITAHVLLAFPLPMNPLNLAIERVFGVNKLEGRRELVMRIALRTLVLALAVLIACVVPYFGDFLGLVSAVAGNCIGLILPVVFYWKMWRRVGPGIKLYEYAITSVILILGVLGMVVGLYFSFSGLIDDIKKNGNPFANFFKAAGCD